MSQFKIGPFEFINLSKLPSYPTKLLTRETRPGQDGVTLWLGGKVAPVQVLQSVVDCSTLADAEAELRAYENLVGAGPVDVVWAGRNQGGVKAIVGGVMPLEEGVHAMVIGIGGTKGTSEAMLRAAWLLHIVSAQQ